MTAAAVTSCGRMCVLAKTLHQVLVGSWHFQRSWSSLAPFNYCTKGTTDSFSTVVKLAEYYLRQSNFWQHWWDNICISKNTSNTIPVLPLVFNFEWQGKHERIIYLSCSLWRYQHSLSLTIVQIKIRQKPLFLAIFYFVLYFRF